MKTLLKKNFKACIVTLILQVFLLNQICYVYPFWQDKSDYSFRIERAPLDNPSDLTSDIENVTGDLLDAGIQANKGLILTYLTGWLKNYAGMDAITDQAVNCADEACSLLAEIAVNYGLSTDEISSLVKKVLENINDIFPSVPGTETNYNSRENIILIIPWITVAVETAVREHIDTASEIASKISRLTENITSETYKDTAVILEIEDVDLTNPFHIAEVSEYLRVLYIQNQMEKIISDNNAEGYEYEKLAGIVIQTGNWLKASADKILETFELLIKNSDKLRAQVKSITGSDNLDYIIPWVGFAMVKGLSSEASLAGLPEIMEICKGASLQNKIASNLGIEKLDYTNNDHVFYLAENAEILLFSKHIEAYLASENLFNSKTRKTLSSYLFSIKTGFGLSKEGVIQEFSDSYDNVKNILGQINDLHGKKDISIDSEEVLPWIWLDMMMRLDPDSKSNINDIISFANTEEGRFITSYLIGETFNPSNIANIAMLSAAYNISLTTQQENLEVNNNPASNSPLYEGEVEEIINNGKVNLILNEILEESNIEEVFAGADYNVDTVKKILVFMILVHEGQAGFESVIEDFTETERNIAEYIISSGISKEQTADIYNFSMEIIRNIRRSQINTVLPDKVEPSKGNWKASLFNITSTFIAAGIAAGVFLAGEFGVSNVLFQGLIAFLTYISVKPIVELGYTGIASMFRKEMPLEEDLDIMENGVSSNQRGMVLRQMYVIKNSQLEEDVLIGEWKKQRSNGNVLLGLVIDVDNEEYRQKTINAYEDLIAKYPEYKDEIYLFIRNKGNWQFEEAYNRKEGRIDDLLTYIYKGKNLPETHLEGNRADLRVRDKNGNIKILGDNFYIDSKTLQLKNSSGKVVKDSNGNIITADKIKFQGVYELKNGNLYDAYGNLISEKNKFTVDQEKGIISFVKTPTRIENIEFEFLLKEGSLYKKSELISSRENLSDENGQIMVNAETGDVITLQDGKIVRGNYIGLDLRRDPFQSLFSDIRGNIENLHIQDEDKKVKYVFIIDEDTTLPKDSIKKMIAKFAHPSNKDYVILQPALKNTNAYDSQFTRVDTLAREMLRFSEFTTWDIFGGVMYGKWGARVKEYYEQLVEKEVADPTARSEDERPALYVPVKGLNDVFWGDEPKRTFYQFMARLKEWTIGDEQTLLKEYLPRVLGGVPYKIYSKLKNMQTETLPKLSAQGKKLLTNLARSIYVPLAFGGLLASYLVAGTTGRLYEISEQSVSNVITSGIVLGTIIFMGKFLAPLVRDSRQQGFSYNLLKEDAKIAVKEFIWSTGLFIPFIWVKSLINWQAYLEIKRADQEARMVPRTAGVIIKEMERFENLGASYKKLIGSPIIGALAVTDLAIINPVALVGLTPIAFAFLFQPTLAFMAEKTTVSLQDALKDIDKKEEYSSVGNVFSNVYKKQSESTMADEKLDRILGLELKFEKSFKLLEENSDNPNLESVIKDTIWKQLTELEKQSLLTELSDENTAKSAVFDYLNAVYNSRIQIEAEENKTIKFKEKIIKTFELKAYSDSLNNANFKKASYALYNYVLTYDSSELNYFEENFQNKISELISFYNLNAKQARDLRKRVD